MLFICFISNSSNSIKSDLLEKLNSSFQIFNFDREFTYHSGFGQPLIVFNSNEINKIAIDNCILLFDENAEINIPQIKSKNTIAIVSSSSTNQINKLAKLNIPVITCGTSQKDTFTYSSNTEDEIVVSLQRTIKSLTGKTIEPFELPIKHTNNCNTYCDLAYSAILAEFDNFEKNYL